MPLTDDSSVAAATAPCAAGESLSHVPFCVATRYRGPQGRTLKKEPPLPFIRNKRKCSLGSRGPWDATAPRGRRRRLLVTQQGQVSTPFRLFSVSQNQRPSTGVLRAWWLYPQDRNENGGQEQGCVGLRGRHDVWALEPASS